MMRLLCILTVGPQPQNITSGLLQKHASGIL